ncbi:MAG: hypothetical protein PVJ69_18980 [Desulfobacteraceae bacterium]|jgi:activator of 2-hydroxyglutaryl-CoA dehydratase
MAKTTDSEFQSARMLREEEFRKVISARIEREEIGCTGARGSDTKYVPPNEVEITEIGVAAKGASFFPSARTVIDCGVEDARAIKCENGLAKDFITNDKCAAGAAFFARALAEKFKKWGSKTAREGAESNGSH